jgi:hypothetical protein
MIFVPIILVLLADNPQAVTGKGAPTPETKAGTAETKTAARSAVFECDFGTTVDRNYDGWPDGWTRRHGAGFHDFIKMGIAEDKTGPARGSALVIQMNGGSAEVGSPKIPITPSFSYELEGECRLTDLVHDDVHIILTFLNAKGKALETHNSTISSQPSSHEWQSFRLRPFTPPPQTTVASFSLQVAPRGVRQDLRGQAAFRRLHLQRLPRMVVRTGSRLNIFTDKEQVEVQCEIAGIPHAQSTLHFELRDHEGRSLAKHPQPLTAGADSVARATWKPPLPDFGFYRVHVRWNGQQNELLEGTASLAVLRPAAQPKAGQFGWTLPAGEDPLESAEMAALLAHAGVHWAKYPVTFTQADARAADRIAWFAEKLSLQGIEMVGVLDHPIGSTTPIADILEDQSVWKPWVDPILTRLSLKVRSWQLGSDQDTSLVGYPRLAERMLELKQHLERFGQQVKLGAGWQWLSSPPAGDVPLAMQSFTSDPPLTATELEAYLTRPAIPSAGASPQRWVTLDPLPKDAYSLASRAHDLSTRMLAAKVAGAEAVFVSRPFDPNGGLMQADGTPGELFLPWRTTAAAISGGEYLGQMQLPGGSINHVFVRDGEAVMVVWNDKPTVETMYFGEDLRQADLWGRETIPPTTTDGGHPQHSVSVGTLPTFVSGLNETVARFKMVAQFEKPDVESIFNREQTILLHLKNFFPQGISGEVKLVTPAGWNLESSETRFRLGPKEESHLPIHFTLSPEASSGPQLLRLDFSLAADRNYQFSVHRVLQLGLADVTITMASRLREDGFLEVTQQLTNTTGKPLSFQCVLFSPGRRRESRQLMAGPNGQTPLLFLLENGESLLGQKLTLRAEELGGGRVLNYSLTADR